MTIQSQIPCQKENHGEIKKSRALLSSFSLKLVEVSTAGHVTGTTSPRRHANRILGGAHGVKTEKIVPRLRGEVRVLSPFSPSSHSLALDRPPLLLLLSLSLSSSRFYSRSVLPAAKLPLLLRGESSPPTSLSCPPRDVSFFPRFSYRVISLSLAWRKKLFEGIALLWLVHRAFTVSSLRDFVRLWGILRKGLLKRLCWKAWKVCGATRGLMFEVVWTGYEKLS